MKKTYMKPSIFTEDLNLQSNVVHTCDDADEWWIEVEIPGWGTLFVEAAGMACDKTPEEYDHDHLDPESPLYDGDGFCYHASTTDGKIFNSL